MKKQKEVEKQRNYVIRPLLKEKFTKSVHTITILIII